MKKVSISIAVTALLWFLMFNPWTTWPQNFWVAMSFAAVILWVLSLTCGKNVERHFSINLRDIVIGLGSAAVLWGIFYIGEYFSTMLFDFARPQVDGIYGLKEGNNLMLVTLGLLFLIGPAEEIFWRGYIQQYFEEKKGKWWGLVCSSLIYTLVHIWSFNFMLIMAALVCGVFWGLLYSYHKNLLTLMISHAVWDVAVFIWFPIM